MPTVSLMMLLLAAQPAGDEPFVEVAGFAISRGLDEGVVRAAFPNAYCVEVQNSHPVQSYCSLRDKGNPNLEGGSVTFQEGHVYRASRIWNIPADLDPYGTLVLLNSIVMRVAGSTSNCAKIEAGSTENTTGSLLVFPSKYVSVETREHPRGRLVKIVEGLRVNPVPKTFRVHGKQNQGTDWCAFTRPH